MRWLAMAAAIGLAACATDRPSEDVDLARFRVGVLTRGDAERMLGPPRYTADLGEGRVRVVWVVGTEGQTPGSGSAKLVSLVFGPDGRLSESPAVSSQVPSRGPAAGEHTLQPATQKFCERNSDCASGLCLNGTCRN